MSSSPWSLELREQAEARLDGGDPLEAPRRAEVADSTDDLRRLNHELEIQRLELELQNDELRRLRDDLECSRDRYRDLYDLAPVGYLTLDAGGRIVDANLTAAVISGTDRDQLTGRRLEELVGTADRARLERHVRRACHRGGRHSCEVVLRRSDGARVPVLLESIRDPAGGRCRVAVLDVSERERARHLEQRVAESRRALDVSKAGLTDVIEDRQRVEGALHKERRLVDYLFQTAPVIILMLDGDGRVVRVSRYLEVVAGYEPADVVGRDWFELVAADGYRKAVRDEFAAVIEDGWVSGRVTSVTTLPLITFDGSTREVEWHTAVVRDGASAVMLAVGLDLSARRRLEHEVQQAQKMEAVGRLASGVAHDFNNVLMGIMGCARVTADKLAPDHPARLFVHEISEAASGGAAVVRQLLSFARKRDDEIQVVEVNQLVARNGTILRSLLGEDVQLAEILSGAPAQVRCNPVELEQVIMNLAANARDAMPQGGTMTMEVTTGQLADHEVAGLTAGDYVRLTVSDTGCGMDEQTLEFLYEPFFTTKPPEQGTGLGLSTVYATIKSLGGAVLVDSEPGQGTTFQIYLPSISERRVPARRPAPPAQALEGWGTVLVVEDDRLVRLAARHYLETAGYTVLEASDEQRALELATSHPGHLHVLLCDVVLAAGSARHIAEQVRLLRPAIEVIFMSAHPAEMLVSSGRLPPGTAVLQKPFMQDELLSLVMDATLEEPRG